MKSIRLEKYADNGVLRDAEDAAWLRDRKITPEDVLDFSDVREVTKEFLEELLAGRERDELTRLITGAAGRVRDSLSPWLGEVEELDPADAFEEELSTEARYTPSRLVERLKRQLTRYIETAYPLADPILLKARRRFLEEENGGRLLAQEPYVETTPRYVTAPKGFLGLALPGHLADFFDSLTRSEDGGPGLLHPRPFEHQAAVLRHFFCEGRQIVVATGTGSGKTECFLLPMLGSLFEEAKQRPASFTRRGVRTLILYPMNALVNDQLSRLRLLLGSEGVAERFRKAGPAARHPVFGMYTGRTPYPGPRSSGKDGQRVGPLVKYYLKLEEEHPDLAQHLRSLGRFPAKDLRSFLAEDKAVTTEVDGKPRTRHHWPQRLHTQPGDRELLTRHEMVHDQESGQGNAPDVLVTNYSMLEYMLMRPFEQPIFEQTRQWLHSDPSNQFLLVVDEAHMYRGAAGAEVAMLIRRLLARLEITERPEKYRVICTSASLGSEEDAKRNAQAFAADLSGRQPQDFEIITGRVQQPEPPSQPSAPAAVFAAVDLERLHETRSGPELGEILEPLLQLGAGNHSGLSSESEIWRRVCSVLRDRSPLSCLLQETAGRAVPLEELAHLLYGEDPDARRATEVLLSLGVAARESSDGPGLVPARIHIFFRGLDAIYACSNPCCPGRQSEPGRDAPVGRLDSQPLSQCEDCGSRTFELASCRRCGCAYLLAYSPAQSLRELTYLWGEAEGFDHHVELLTVEPEDTSQTREIRVALSSGVVDTGLKFPEDKTRSLWVADDGEHQGGAFERCPHCQADNPRARSNIRRFQTRGEQPFTALLEAQFSEQPPHLLDSGSRNQGRKVLVFSDGRQKAARLAPALETSHSRDASRQVLCLATAELEKHLGKASVSDLYVASLYVCEQRGLELYPRASEQIFHQHLSRVRNQKGDFGRVLALKNSLQPTRSFAQHLHFHLTDRFYSLSSLGLARVYEEPDLATVFESFPPSLLKTEMQRLLFRMWLRVQMEQSRFLPDGVSVRDLTEGWNRPTGIDLEAQRDVLPDTFRKFLGRVLESEDHVAAIHRWLLGIIRDCGVFLQESDRYFLSPSSLCLELGLSKPWFQCLRCSRLYPQQLENLCPECLGRVEPANPESIDLRTGYYRDQVQRAFLEEGHEPFSLIAEEHSAQLTETQTEKVFNRTESYELRFQDVPIHDKGRAQPPIDVLSCTTTMEVGIDIGSLIGVALRNVPPHVANYQQRAGRAGRRGRSLASVVTYAHGNTHDAYYFENPDRIISGKVRSPMVYVENAKVIQRHINAFLLQTYFHETVARDPEAYQLFESLGTVQDFLGSEHGCSLEGLKRWLVEREPELRQRLENWVPAISHRLNEPVEDRQSLIAQAGRTLLTGIEAVLPVEEFAQREQLEKVEREALERCLEDKLLSMLIEKAVLPRYAFPTDVVSFWVPTARKPTDPPNVRRFEYSPQRDLKIALSEYAPGRNLTIDKWRFTSAALYSPYQPGVRELLEKAKSYTNCKSCGFVSLRLDRAELSSCPCCGNVDLQRQPMVRPQGFAASLNKPYERDRGGSVTYVGSTGRANLEVKEVSAWENSLFDGRLRLLSSPRELVVVNKGIQDRGFMICPDCGLAEPCHGPGFTNTSLSGKRVRAHPHPLQERVNCPGEADGPFFLGYQFVTDVLLLRLRLKPPMHCRLAGDEGKATRSALTTLVEALSLAASRVIQVEEGELAGNWSPVQASKHHEVDLFFYDLLPGGAGYARLMAEEVNAVFEEAARLLDGCTCESSCYQCLRHYGNVMVHRSLDRRLGASLLGYICTGRAPRLDPTKKSKALLPLVELLAVQGYDIKSDEEGPIEVSRKLGEAVLVDVYPALVEPTQFCSSARSKAWQAKKRFAALDEYVLAHDLPEAFRRVQSCGAGAPSIEFEQVKGLGEVGQVAECSLREWDDSGNPKVLRQLPVDGAVEGCFVARLEGGLERLYDPGSLGLFRHVHSHDDLPPRDSLVLVRHPDLCDPDLGAVTVRRFRWSERHDSDGQATHVKLELRPYTTERERYRTQYLEIPVEEWSGWRPVAVLTRVVDGQTSERRSNSTSGGTD